MNFLSYWYFEDLHETWAGIFLRNKTQLLKTSSEPNFQWQVLSDSGF